MAEPKQGNTAVMGPPALVRTVDGDVETASLADLVEWFLNYDERVAIMRHPNVEELFQWKQKESLDSGVPLAPFDHAEDRFAIGIFQAMAENRGALALHTWLSNLLQALNDATHTNEEIAEAFKLNADEPSALRKSEQLPTDRERRVYLTCCWLEALCTAEARVLGWVYQELYGAPFNPQTPPFANQGSIN
ncbi:MAG: hypothetical protein ABIP75_10345 [Pyrinomonadaceae bacterium]